MTTATTPGRFRLFGSTLRLLWNPLRALTELPAHGDIVAIGVGRWRAFVVCEPELLKQVLVDDRTYDKGGLIAERFSVLLGNGVATCSHVDHRRQRRLVQPAFHKDLLRGYTEMMPEQVTTVIETWRDGEVVDVMAAMYAITTRISCATMFATELPAHRITQVTRDLDIFLSGVYRRIILPSLLDGLPTPGRRRFDEAVARMRNLGAAIVTGSPTTDPGVILSVLKAECDENGDGPSETELVDQVMNFLAATVDTVGATLTWALHLLTEHPDIAERLHRETDTVLAGRTPTAADLPALELTRRVITETLRLYPPAWALTRVARTGTELGGYHIPVGATLLCSPYLMHHRADIYPDPERFDPDRNYDRRALHALFPFGAGARKCLGDSFALAEATLTLATIASKWRFEAVSDDPVRAAPRFVLAPRALRLRAVAR
ncbi:cytochrome P450 [Nocardia sp. KC 131]|uniref:cytochrome P450 n=1 Tax=Nocardia arseniciresistens TaxID=3392119 RepID=UPI00398E59B2